jgi:thiamine biosynthesis lipoprotein
MGTFLEITLFSNNKKEAIKIINECYELADDLEKKASNKIIGSIVSNLNKNKELKIEDEFVSNLIKESLELAELSEGTFDPSLYNLTDLWGFEKGNNKVPQKDDIIQALTNSGYKNVLIKDDIVKLINNVSIDLGGIAKGKIIGKLSDYLLENGINDYIINGGGDLVVEGRYEGKRLWNIAIINPFHKENLIGVISLSDKSIVTSGDYERFFLGNDGTCYHHIIDPKTGYPADNGIHSVTLITEDPAKADALATAVFVMGIESGLKFVNSIDDLEAIIVAGTEKNMEISTSNKIIVEKKDDGMYKFVLEDSK